MTTEEDFRRSVVEHDLEVITHKEKTYQGSWKKRGGVGAFMMLARMWDRIENMVQSPSLDSKYDIFDAIGQDTSGNDGTVLAILRDLRRYAILIEAEMIRRQKPYEARHVKIPKECLTDPPTRIDYTQACRVGSTLSRYRMISRLLAKSSVSTTTRDLFNSVFKKFIQGFDIEIHKRRT